MPGGLEAWLLNGTFRANLRMALSGGGQVGGADMVKLGHIQALKIHNVYHLQPWTMSAYLEPDPRARDVTFLDQ